MATSSARGKTDAMNEDLANAILSQIREDELVAMCSDVVNIPSATGEELEMGRYMRRALEAPAGAPPAAEERPRKKSRRAAPMLLACGKEQATGKA